MIYVIDHNDSFTHNVVHQFSLFDKVECDTYNNVNRLKLRQAKVIIFSPGPGNVRSGCYLFHFNKVGELKKQIPF